MEHTLSPFAYKLAMVRVQQALDKRQPSCIGTLFAVDYDRCTLAPESNLHTANNNAWTKPQILNLTVKSYLIICALGEDRTCIANELSRVILECGCRIVEAHMSMLEADSAITILVHGNWNTLAKLEVQLKRQEQSLGISILIRRTQERKLATETLPYSVEVIALDQPGIVHNLANFFCSRAINLEDLVARSYQAPHTGTPMFSVNIVIGIPADMHIALIRDEFMDFCDQLNLDAVLEPLRT